MNRLRLQIDMFPFLSVLYAVIGVLNSWHERAEIASALRKTFFRQTAQAPDPDVPFQLDAVTVESIEGLKSHPNPLKY